MAEVSSQWLAPNSAPIPSVRCRSPGSAAGRERPVWSSDLRGRKETDGSEQTSVLFLPRWGSRVRIPSSLTVVRSTKASSDLAFYVVKPLVEHPLQQHEADIERDRHAEEQDCGRRTLISASRRSRPGPAP